MYIGSNDKKHAQFINKSYLSLCDGTGLVIAENLMVLTFLNIMGLIF